VRPVLCDSEYGDEHICPEEHCCPKSIVQWLRVSVHNLGHSAAVNTL